MNNIVSFIEAKGIDISLVGGKGLNLSLMVLNNINVPDGFIILSSAYSKFIEENNLADIIKEKINSMNNNNIDDKLEDIRQLIVSSDFSDDVKKEIKICFELFEAPIHLAVRSSATTEDLDEASFAGQQETFLNIRTFDNLLESIKKCFASLWKRRSVEYRLNSGFDIYDVSIAVIIQKMINSEVSGVIFTSNPISFEKEILIEASYGLGEAIVSGRVNPDTYKMDDNGNLKEYSIGLKDIQIIYSDEGINQVPVVQEYRKKRCLSDLDLKELYYQINKIKSLYNEEMDIEWAKEEGKFHILQARKITTKNKKDIFENKDMGIHFGKKEKKYLNNMIEHFPVLWFPLDDEVAMILQNSKYELLKQVGIFIDNPLKMNDLGIIEVDKVNLKINYRILKYPLIYNKYKNHSFNIEYSKSEMNIIEKQINEIEKNINKNINNYSIKKIIENIELLIDLHKKISYIRFRYILFPSVILGNKLNKIVKKIDNNYTEYDLLSNLDYKTILMNKDLNKLVSMFNSNIQIKNEISINTDIEHLQNIYIKEFELFNVFLKKYGWKSNYPCIPFSSISWKEEPERLLKIILLCCNEEKNNINKKLTYNMIIENLKFRNKNNILEKINIYREYHVMREDSQYLWENIFGLLRFLVKVISNKLNIKYEDILFLKLNELKKVTDEYKIDDAIYIINKRKTNRRKSEIKWENMIVSIFSDTNKEEFLGVSGSSGKVQGRVCIIKSHSEFNKLNKGEILVCPYTDPEWTPLFKIAKGVISDTGGALSHAAIVAREYDIPAVLGVGNATKNLKDGDMVTVDGDRGIVKKII